MGGHYLPSGRYIVFHTPNPPTQSCYSTLKLSDVTTKLTNDECSSSDSQQINHCPLIHVALQWFDYRGLLGSTAHQLVRERYTVNTRSVEHSFVVLKLTVQPGWAGVGPGAGGAPVLRGERPHRLGPVCLQRPGRAHQGDRDRKQPGRSALLHPALLLQVPGSLHKF